MTQPLNPRALNLNIMSRLIATADVAASRLLTHSRVSLPALRGRC
jgi:hypothetical protein